MIRVIVREIDVGGAANVGAPVQVAHRTFDLMDHHDSNETARLLRALEDHLRYRQTYVTREVVGVELRDKP